VVIEVAGRGSKDFFRLAVFIESGIAKARIGPDIVVLEIKTVLN
jgi:hypothetical protein